MMLDAYNNQKWKGTASMIGNGLKNVWNWTQMEPLTDDKTLVVAYRDDTYLVLDRETDGSLVLYRSNGFNITSTEIGRTGAGAIQVQTWHYIEMRLRLDESPDGQAELWVDGVRVINLTATDTQFATSQPDRSRAYIMHEGSSSRDSLFDDVYVLDTDTTSPQGGTSPNSARLGDIVIEAFVPTSDDTNDFTRSSGSNNYELVDETPADDDTTYVESNTVGHEDRYGLGNRTHTGDMVGVSAYWRAKKTDANARQLTLGLVSNSGATIDPNTETMSLTNGTYTAHTKTYDRDFVDGVTAADWDTTKVNALEISQEVV